MKYFSFAPFTLPIDARPDPPKPLPGDVVVTASSSTTGRVGADDGKGLDGQFCSDPLHPHRPRIVLYSHDTCGLGHTRRNLLLAKALAAPPLEADILLITGIGQAREFAPLRGIDLLTLPALFKEGNGQYRSRAFGVEVQELMSLRSRLIRVAVEGFRPDLLIVDNVPRGAMGELDDALGYATNELGSRCVLGLRDVLDDPEVIIREWNDNGSLQVVREAYDAIWVYGDPNVYDLACECKFPPDVQLKLTFTGYLDGRARILGMAAPGGYRDSRPHGFPEGRMHLCVVGGGQDGEQVAENFIGADLPPDAAGLVLTGPFMPENVHDRLALMSVGRRLMYVVGFYAEPVVLMEEAERVVSMGGYNSVCELLSLEKDALIIPRIAPRQEQLIRARRLQELGLVDMLHPDCLTPNSISAWLARPPSPRGEKPLVDMSALERVPNLAASLLGLPHRSVEKTVASHAAL